MTEPPNLALGLVEGGVEGTKEKSTLKLAMRGCREVIHHARVIRLYWQKAHTKHQVAAR